MSWSGPATVVLYIEVPLGPDREVCAPVYIHQTSVIITDILLKKVKYSLQWSHKVLSISG